MCVFTSIFYYLQEARSYAEENGLLFLETSAKTGSNVNEIFLLLGESNSKNDFLVYLIFTARRSYASAVLGVVILSVHPSVCPSVTRMLCD